MTKTVKIKLQKKTDYSYPILISAGMNLAKEIKKLKLNNNYVIITDNRIYKLYKDEISRQFLKENLNHKFIPFKHGERSKNLRIFQKISEKMLKMGFDRKSCLIALGGGVVGDMAGYIAGTYMRGIPYIQIPTTLLSQVDSSIGGKTAVDLKYGKNATGLFYQPSAVLIDINFLRTLPEIEFNNGMMEIIKHGIIKDNAYFKFIENNILKIIKKEPVVLTELIYKSCLIKGDIVQKDEKEKGLRRILNFGHTIGHALEVIKNYKLKHGMAVGLGIIKEAEFSHKLGYLSKADLMRQSRLIEMFGVKPLKYNKKKLLSIIINDKKNIRTSPELEPHIPLILPIKTGKVIIKNFTLDELKKII